MVLMEVVLEVSEVILEGCVDVIVCVYVDCVM